MTKRAVNPLTSEQVQKRLFSGWRCMRTAVFHRQLEQHRTVVPYAILEQVWDGIWRPLDNACVWANQAETCVAKGANYRVTRGPRAFTFTMCGLFEHQCFPHGECYARLSGSCPLTRRTGPAYSLLMNIGSPRFDPDYMRRSHALRLRMYGRS